MGKINPLLDLYKTISLWNEIYDTAVGRAIGVGDLQKNLSRAVSYIDSNLLLNESDTENLKAKLKNLESLIKPNINLRDLLVATTGLIEESIFKKLVKNRDYELIKIEIIAIKDSYKRLIQTEFSEVDRKWLN